MMLKNMQIKQKMKEIYYFLFFIKEANKNSLVH